MMNYHNVTLFKKFHKKHDDKVRSSILILIIYLLYNKYYWVSIFEHNFYIDEKYNILIVSHELKYKKFELLFCLFLNTAID